MCRAVRMEGRGERGRVIRPLFLLFPSYFYLARR